MNIVATALGRSFAGLRCADPANNPNSTVSIYRSSSEEISMVPSTTAEVRETVLQQPQRTKIPRGQLLINGKWRDGKTGETMTTVDPTTEEAITEVVKASAQDAHDAVDAAYSAFEDGP